MFSVDSCQFTSGPYLCKILFKYYIVYLQLEMFLKGSTVSLFLFVSFLMTVECILTDDFIVMIMGIIITRRDGRIPHGRYVVT